jgi:acetylxylan esterase
MFMTSARATGAATLVASSLLFQSAAGALITRQDDCSDVHIFLAKGNNETEPGRQGKLVQAICSGLDSCDYEDIHFDNRYETVFCDSLVEGARNGRAQLTDYAERCPDSQLVVSGYSQGAHVVGDILGGGGGIFFQNCSQTPNEPLDPSTSPGNKSKVTPWCMPACPVEPI